MASRKDTGPWIDCNDHGEPHDWQPSHREAAVGREMSRWFRCTRCPVTTRVLGVIDDPRSFLRPVAVMS